MVWVLQSRSSLKSSLLSWEEGGCFVPRDTAQGSGSGSLSLPGKREEKPEIQQVAAEKSQALQRESAAEEVHLLGVRRHLQQAHRERGGVAEESSVFLRAGPLESLERLPPLV